MAVFPIVGDILRLTLTGNYAAVQAVNNVFYYEVTNITPGAMPPPSVYNYCWGLWVTLRENYTTVLAADNMNFLSVKGELLDAETQEFVFAEEYNVAAIEQRGGINDDCLPPSDAYQIRLQRPSADFRHGYKRFAGVPETFQDGGNLTAPAFLDLVALSVALALPIKAYREVFAAETPYVDAAMELRVGQFIHNGDPLDVPVFAAPSALVAKAQLVTQNTRKFGVGS